MRKILLPLPFSILFGVSRYKREKEVCGDSRKPVRACSNSGAIAGKENNTLVDYRGAYGLAYILN